MSGRSNRDLGSLSMDDLFRMEVDTQASVLTDGLLAVERGDAAAEWLASLMRAAHSLKGAGRMVGNDGAVRVAHAMEEVFIAAQEGRAMLSAMHVDVLLRGLDLIRHLAAPGGKDRTGPDAVSDETIEQFLTDITALPANGVPASAAPGRPSAQLALSPAASMEPSGSAPGNGQAATRTGAADTSAATVRVAADRLNRLLGLAAESLTTARSLNAFAGELQRLKRTQDNVARLLADAAELAAHVDDERVAGAIQDAYGQVARSLDGLVRFIADLETFDRRAYSVSHRMYEEVLAARMRPFGDAVEGLPRLARDLARSLGKQARVVVSGESTPIDRDILRHLEGSLIHLVRNAVDHGIESPEDRLARGKPAEGTIQLQARHSMGMLIVAIIDDGRGISPETLRTVVVDRKLTTADVAARLRDAELFEFLFLPGFSTAKAVTEISGRGVGLDVVQTMVRDVGGRIDVVAKDGEGMRIQMQLPLTLSVLRALIVSVSGEPYAIPLSRVTRVERLQRAEVLTVEGREHFLLDGRSVGLLGAEQVLDTGAAAPARPDLPIVVVSNKTSQYGIVVDALLGERELVVRPLDERLGKVPNVSAAALLPDGAPVLIIDVDDLVRSAEVLVSGGRLTALTGPASAGQGNGRRRILVVDDSITVRETERKLLEQAGYEVDVAVDGMDGWNAVRSGRYDLIVTDVDMPRLDGIELCKLIRRDHRLKALPIMIVSYKDREEDRLRGLDAGADYYLTKASFHDDTLLRATAQLIGEQAS